MNRYRHVAASLVLALVLCATSFAGVMQTGVADPDPQPTPTPSSMTQMAASDDMMQTGEIASTSEAADTATEIALNLLQSVFSLF